MRKLLLPAISAGITACLLNTANARPVNGSGNPFSQINDEIVLIKNDVASLQDQVNALIGRVGSLEEKVSANAGAIAALQVRDDYLQRLISDNNLTLNRLKQAIEELDQANVQLKAQLDANSGDINILKDQMANNAALIQSLGLAIEAVEQKSLTVTDGLQQQIDDNLSLINYIQSDISAINNMLDTQQGLVSGKCPDGSAVQEILADGSFVCVQVSGGGGGLIRVYSKSNYRSIGANQTIALPLYCDPGDIATGAGHFGYQNIDVMSNYAGNYDDNGLNQGYGYVYSTNTNAFSVLGGVVVNCMDTTP